MPSFQITIAPSRRAAARYVVHVRRELQRAFAAEAASTGLTQAEIARRLNVNRSVINRELKGEKDITQGRVGELAWAMGYRPRFSLEKITDAPGTNAADAALQRANKTATKPVPINHATSTGASTNARARVIEMNEYA